MTITLLGVVTVLGTFLAAFFLFGITVFVHELGHFLAAKRKGLVIEKFAIGFGPKAWGWKKDGVEYVINWLPFGGFVQLPQMAAMEMVEGKSELAAKALPVASPWAKIVTAFWGPMFSFFLALLLAFVVYWVGTPQNQSFLTTTVGYVEPESPAAKAGILPGDEIVSVNDRKVTRWAGRAGGVVEAIILSIGKEVVLDVKRGDQTLRFSIPPVRDPEIENLRSLGFEKYQMQPLIVEQVLENSPAARAGLQAGDRVLTVNGSKAYNAAHFKSLMSSEDSPSFITFQRNDQTLEVQVAPEQAVNVDRKLIGVIWDYDQVAIVHIDPLTQISNSATFIFRTLRAVTSHQSDVGVRHLSGPVGIFDKLMVLLTTDPRLVLYFTVILNVNLAIVNLLPIPILDGGHILLSALEAVRRRPLEDKWLSGIQTSFFVLLIGLFVFITYFDVGRVAKRVTQKKPQAMEMPQFAKPN